MTGSAFDRHAKEEAQFMNKVAQAQRDEPRPASPTPPPPLRAYERDWETPATPPPPCGAGQALPSSLLGAVAPITFGQMLDQEERALRSRLADLELRRDLVRKHGMLDMPAQEVHFIIGGYR